MGEGVLMCVCAFKFIYCKFICVLPLLLPDSTGAFENKDRPGLQDTGN